MILPSGCTAERKTFLSGYLGPLDSTAPEPPKETTMPMITVDRAAWNQLRAEAAAAPALVAQARAALSAPESPVERSDEQWEDWLASTGLPGHQRLPKAPGAIWTGGAVDPAVQYANRPVSSLSTSTGRTDADYDSFVASLHLGRPR